MDDLAVMLHRYENEVELYSLIQRILDHYLLGIYISRTSSGDILYKKEFQLHQRFPLLANFISALAMFGEENIGQIKRIIVEGLDVEMVVISKHGLILTVLFKPNMVTDYLTEESGACLDQFYEQFKAQIESGKTNQEIYAKFDGEMNNFIFRYLSRIGVF
jgi:hypothetical protein